MSQSKGTNFCIGNILTSKAFKSVFFLHSIGELECSQDFSESPLLLTS